MLEQCLSGRVLFFFKKNIRVKRWKDEIKSGSEQHEGDKMSEFSFGGQLHL